MLPYRDRDRRNRSLTLETPDILFPVRQAGRWSVLQVLPRMSVPLLPHGARTLTARTSPQPTVGPPWDSGFTAVTQKQKMSGAPAGPSECWAARGSAESTGLAVGAARSSTVVKCAGSSVAGPGFKS